MFYIFCQADLFLPKAIPEILYNEATLFGNLVWVDSTRKVNAIPVHEKHYSNNSRRVKLSKSGY